MQHEFNLKMIKISLAIVTLAVIIDMIGGISILKNSYYWREKYFALQWDYVKTEIAYIEYKNGNVINWLLTKAKNNSSAAVAKGEATSIPILVYHGVISDPDWKPDNVSVRLEDFRNQMFALKHAGYQTITVAQYLDFAKGKKPLPEKSFMLTFDDGRKDSYYPVDPILRVLGYTAEMNVITGRSLGPDNEKSSFHLSKTELEKMVASGRWELESHGRDDHDEKIIDTSGKQGYFLTNKLWLGSAGRMETDEEYQKRIYADLNGSKNDLEKNLGIKVLAFAYPFGDFGQSSQNYPEGKNVLLNITNSIYPLSFYQAGNSDFPENYVQNPFLSKRIGVDSSISPEKLLVMLGHSQKKPVGYQDNFSGDNGWLRGWGSFDIRGNAMTIGGTPEEDSALTFLDGTYMWKNYFVQAKVKIQNGNAYALMARYNSEGNYITCDFSDTDVALTQVVNREEKPDIEAPNNVILNSGQELQAGIYVNGNTASCYLDGKKIVSGVIDSHLDHGGFGFKTWNTTDQNATLTVRELRTGESWPIINSSR